MSSQIMFLFDFDGVLADSSPLPGAPAPGSRGHRPDPADPDDPRWARPDEQVSKAPDLLDQFGASPRQAVMVGDAVSDIRAGQANGMRTAAVTWGWQRRDLLAAAGPDWILTRVEALLTLPNRLRSQSS